MRWIPFSCHGKNITDRSMLRLDIISLIQLLGRIQIICYVCRSLSYSRSIYWCRRFFVLYLLKLGRLAANVKLREIPDVSISLHLKRPTLISRYLLSAGVWKRPWPNLDDVSMNVKLISSRGFSKDFLRDAPLQHNVVAALLPKILSITGKPSWKTFYL